jgi:hypothetical protein
MSAGFIHSRFIAGWPSGSCRRSNYEVLERGTSKPSLREVGRLQELVDRTMPAIDDA